MCIYINKDGNINTSIVWLTVVDAVIVVYLTNQRAGSPPGLVTAGPWGGKHRQEDCKRKWAMLVPCNKIGCSPP